jgi:hypothetical protein
LKSIVKARGFDPVALGNSTIEKYQLRSDTGPKPEYIIAYHGGKSNFDENESRDYKSQFRNWSNELDVPFGSPMSFVSYAGTIDSRKEFTTRDQPSASGYTVFRADSLDSAISIASDCPHLDFDGSIEVFTINDV